VNAKLDGPRRGVGAVSEDQPARVVDDRHVEDAVAVHPLGGHRAAGRDDRRERVKPSSPSLRRIGTAPPSIEIAADAQPAVL
jgi:hypothetical protein